ncbi:MAG TPA: hypothetical protein VF041_03360 [Gemmatimonadaceae bacterium]
MAELKVQEKRGSRAWLWIIALIILAIIVWFALSRRHTGPAATGSITPSSTPALALATPGEQVRTLDVGGTHGTR